MWIACDDRTYCSHHTTATGVTSYNLQATSYNLQAMTYDYGLPVRVHMTKAPRGLPITSNSMRRPARPIPSRDQSSVVNGQSSVINDRARARARARARSE